MDTPHNIARLINQPVLLRNGRALTVTGWSPAQGDTCPEIVWLGAESATTPTLARRARARYLRSLRHQSPAS